ncbi:TadE/TadG family type IV pilus assembly protein [Endozoicomonas atrinae]|uniref:TadE/TadG family type IV pilus assembly protein n=1 Tax=Endozoicomonas atrinae TaxID=1333660 RepID=UPI0008246F8E|nr:TadE/TadG family type IV pilus assembly protein [Endozoicomonas atrinae]
MKTQYRSGARYQQGLALVEVTIVLPFLLLLLAVIIDFGRVFYESSLLQGRLNAAARYLAMNTQAGVCEADGGDKDYCDIATYLVLNASPKEGADEFTRFTVNTPKAYPGELNDTGDHWQVSAIYTPESIVGNLLPDDFSITQHAIQRALIGSGS